MTDSNSDKKRGEKRGVVSNERARKLDTDASDDAANDDEEED